MVFFVFFFSFLHSHPPPFHIFGLWRDGEFMMVSLIYLITDYWYAYIEGADMWNTAGNSSD